MERAIIYSTVTCPYCIKAKAVFKQMGVSYQEIIVDISTEESKAEYRRSLSEKTGLPISTVPQVFLDNVYIGGFDDLNAYYDKLENSEMLHGLSDFDL